MNENRDFVINILNHVRDEIVVAIEEGKLPAEWVGGEMRQYIVDAVDSHLNPKHFLKGARRARYDAWMLVNSEY